MSLAAFIKSNVDRIVDDCELFARTMLPAAASMDKEALRDHAAQILEAVWRDLGRPQSPSEQHQKSLGRAPIAANAPETAAQTHGTLRAGHGFNISQTAAEYRALRASVLRLWFETAPILNADAVDEITRFNEALDQALAESIAYFAAAAARDRNLFLGVLSHELRTPLATIHASGHIVSRSADPTIVKDAVARQDRATKRIESVLNDLLDFVRAGSGGMRVTPSSTRVDELCLRIGRELETAHDRREILVACTGDMTAVWDEQRVAQALSNLVNNALKYGSRDAAVSVAADGSNAHTIVIEVTNAGDQIPSAVRDSLFEPLVRGTGNDSTGVSLGLGLYIVRQIARAHGGDVSVESTERTTVFRMSLRRFCNPIQANAFGNLGIH